MKPLLIGVGVCVLILLANSSGSAQTATANHKNSEQVMSELVDEVRMLRLEVRRLSSGAVRAQTLLERIRGEQEQVTRLTTEQTRLREQLRTVRTQRIELRAKVAVMQQQSEAGVTHAGDLEIAKAVLGDLDVRESEFATREMQLHGEFHRARSALQELNNKLDALERELLNESKRN